MCGFCGVVSVSTEASVLHPKVMRMADAIAHRGPDDAGVFVHDNVVLGHRRLSIVDLSTGNQPMHSANEQRTIVFNGEIFNHPVLFNELEASGVKYRTRSDTETILHVTADDALAGVKRLRGMFAFAIWDKSKRELLIVRDRFGVKPMYYHLDDDGTLWFASEIKSLLAGGAVTAKLDESALPSFLANRAPMGTQTLYQGVKRLEPGCAMRWRDGKIEIFRYWDLPAAGEKGQENLRDEEVSDEFYERLKESVRLRLMSDVPLGVFLSGGIDSSAIAAIMRDLGVTDLKTFSVAFEEREANEFEYARLMARHIGAEHHEVQMGRDDFFAALPLLTWHEDEPIAHPSSVPLHMVSRLAAQHVKVVLTGEGSDELLAGYGRYRWTMLNDRVADVWKHVPKFARGAVSSSISRFADGGNKLAQKFSRTVLVREPTLEALYLDNFAAFGQSALRGMLASDVRARVSDIDAHETFRKAYEGRSGGRLGKLLYGDAKTYLHELLMKQDQMSMGASIESRVPFLDHPLAEWVTALPDRFKLRGNETKWLLRAAMKNRLPDTILNRPKMGFPVPVGTWIRGPLKASAEELLLGSRAASRGVLDAAAVRAMFQEHVSGTRKHDERLWVLMGLELWHRIFIDGEEHQSVAKSLGWTKSDMMERMPIIAPKATPSGTV
ncbi:MAG: asparagine synthase (glutamine-hydrolyzing) [Gemmatimonadaceae bacterium]